MDTSLLLPCDFLGKSTGVGCHFLLQRIFLTQGSNPGLPYCRQMLYHLSHQGSHSIIYICIHTHTHTHTQTYMCAKSLPSWSTLCDPMDHSPPGSSVHGILQAKILEWVAISFSRRSSQPRDATCLSYVSCIDR